jgi:hypothetical protein
MDLSKVHEKQTAPPLIHISQAPPALLLGLALGSYHRCAWSVYCSVEEGPSGTRNAPCIPSSSADMDAGAEDSGTTLLSRLPEPTKARKKMVAEACVIDQVGAAGR